MEKPLGEVWNKIKEVGNPRWKQRDQVMIKKLVFFNFLKPDYSTFLETGHVFTTIIWKNRMENSWEKNVKVCGE